MDRGILPQDPHPPASSGVPAKFFRDARAAAADDGRRAVAIVRERAREWDVDPAKVGMIGFVADFVAAFKQSQSASSNPSL